MDAIYFCSKNYRPLFPHLAEITGRYRTLFHVTVNAYSQDLEPASPALSARVQMAKTLSALVGRERVFWRYDPIVLTPRYTVPFHLSMFETLAAALAPYVAGCIVNFIEYTFNMPSALRTEEFTKTAKRAFIMRLGSICKRYRLPVRICGKGEDYAAFGVSRGGCLTLDDIGKANSCEFRRVKHLGNRRGCSCITCRDIGSYDSCPAGCVYCNANRNPDLVKENVTRHDENSPLLLGGLQSTDVLSKSPQESDLRSDGQMSLFDL